MNPEMKDKAARIGLFFLQCVCIFICVVTGIVAMFFAAAALSAKFGMDELYRLRTGEEVYTPDFLTTPPRQFIKGVLWRGEKPTTTLSDDEPVRDNVPAESGSVEETEEEPSGSDIECSGDHQKVG